jgi:hypothetical protein
MLGSKEPDLNTEDAQVVEQPAEKKSLWKTILPVMACGAGLFSDGYINNVRIPTYTKGPSLYAVLTM